MRFGTKGLYEKHLYFVEIDDNFIFVYNVIYIYNKIQESLQLHDYWTNCAVRAAKRTSDAPLARHKGVEHLIKIKNVWEKKN